MHRVMSSRKRRCGSSNFTVGNWNTLKEPTQNDPETSWTCISVEVGNVAAMWVFRSQNGSRKSGYFYILTPAENASLILVSIF